MLDGEDCGYISLHWELIFPQTDKENGRGWALGVCDGYKYEKNCYLSRLSEKKFPMKKSSLRNTSLKE